MSYAVYNIHDCLCILLVLKVLIMWKLILITSDPLAYIHFELFVESDDYDLMCLLILKVIPWKSVLQQSW